MNDDRVEQVVISLARIGKVVGTAVCFAAPTTTLVLAFPRYVGPIVLVAGFLYVVTNALVAGLSWEDAQTTPEARAALGAIGNGAVLVPLVTAVALALHYGAQAETWRGLAISASYAAGIYPAFLLGRAISRRRSTGATRNAE